MISTIIENNYLIMCGMDRIDILESLKIDMCTLYKVCLSYFILFLFFPQMRRYFIRLPTKI